MSTVNGIWVLSPRSFTTISQSVKFSSNGKNYTSFNVTTSGVRYGSSYVYDILSGWTNKAYRVVDFGSAEQEVSSTFYDWLTKNATKDGVTKDLRLLFLGEGVYSITVRAEADGYADSLDSNAVSYEVVADELAGTWVFNDRVDMLSDGTKIVFEFVRPTSSNPSNITYGYKFTKNTSTNAIYGLSSSGSNASKVYDASTGWTSTTQQTIFILSKLADVENGATLLSWLTKNATKQ